MDSMERSPHWGHALGALSLFGLLILALLATLMNRQPAVRAEAARIEKDRIQAVFLNDGQVYFGDLAAVTSTTMVMENIFYLADDQNLQTPEAAQGEEAPKFTLVKLGTSELHRPEDRMMIARDEVTFWENLQEDAPIVKTIREFQSK